MRPALIVALPALLLLGTTLRSPPAERVEPNDNLRPAGTLHDGGLDLDLQVVEGEWHPDGDAAPGAVVPVFAEAGGAPRIPGPLIRVPAGTEVRVALRNRLADSVAVHGLHTRPGPGEPIVLPPGGSAQVRFRLDSPGTYFYYGVTTGRAFDFRTLHDAQLTGAIVVDGPGPREADRIFVMGMWTDTVSRAYTRRSRLLAVINGRSWPHTEKLSHVVGDSVRWRVINASTDAHPMHLHGFYFRVDSRGDFLADTLYTETDRDRVVTEGMVPGATMSLTWVPERAGNWLFHCHIPEHFSPKGPLGQVLPASHSAAHAHGSDHASGGMSGLVLGVSVGEGAGAAAQAEPPGRLAADQRRIRLLVRRNLGGTDSLPYYGFALQEGSAEPPSLTGLRHGPPILLTRGEPAAITVVNRLAEPTAVHWHGIELDSYFDGVPGFSGDGARLSPLIAAGDSFEVRFTPPRAGTFIYHTHVDEERQQLAGLAGPLIVLEPGERFDPEIDHVVLVTSPTAWENQLTSVSVNGSLTPAPLLLKAGRTHRLRFINMTIRRPALRVDLRQDTALVSWRTVAKDGADLPTREQILRPARHGLALGETFDVELEATTPGEMQLSVRIGGRVDGPILATVPVRIVP